MIANQVIEASSAPSNVSAAIVAEAPASLGHAEGALVASSASSGTTLALLAAPGPSPADPTVPWVGTPEPGLAPKPSGGLSADEAARLSGVRLLAALGGMTAEELARLQSEHPETIAGLLASPPAATQVREWWSATPASGRIALRSALPGLVGNLEGVPYGVRDLANRAYLDRAASAIRAEIAAGVGHAVEDELETRLHMLGEVAEALRTGDSGERRQLVALDPTGDGRAVIAVGNVETARYVSYLVPGMYYAVDAELVGWARVADELVVEQQDWIERLTGEDPSGTVAALAWIGYETPTAFNVASMDLAREGETALTASLRGLDARRGPDAGAPAYVTVIGHSYGSTAALLALQENDVAVNSLVLLGSPGSPAQSVADLHVGDGGVWVGAAEWDPIPTTGIFGSQPTAAGYGATRFGVDGAVDPVTGERLGEAFSHLGYFVPGSESQRNIALIALGRGDLVLR